MGLANKLDLEITFGHQKLFLVPFFGPTGGPSLPSKVELEITFGGQKLFLVPVLGRPVAREHGSIGLASKLEL